jgi:hypothetical protein
MFRPPPLFWWANGIRIFSLCCFCEKLIYWGRSKNREIGIETTMQLKMNLGLGCAAIAMTIVTILVNKL